MAEMIADLLQRHALGHQMRRAGVTQGMPSAPWTLDIECVHAGHDNVVQAVGGQRSYRSPDGQEQGPRRAAGSDQLQIPQDGLSHLCGERVVLFATLLRATDVKDVPLPVHVIQRQGNNLTTTQAVDGKQQQDGTITYIFGVVRCGTGDESSHVLPLGSDGQFLLREQPGALDCGCKAGCTAALFEWHLLKFFRVPMFSDVLSHDRARLGEYRIGFRSSFEGARLDTTGPFRNPRPLPFLAWVLQDSDSAGANAPANQHSESVADPASAEFCFWGRT